MALAGACESAKTTTEGSGGASFNPTGTGGFNPDDACALYEEQAITRPASLYVMFDKSSSMAGSKWQSAKAGFGAFADDPNSAGIFAALRFFPREPDATPACDQKAYAEPTVPFGELPAHGTALKAALDAESPDGFGTPMYPALGGALLKGIEVAETNKGEGAAVLLVTDGVPEGPAATCGGVDPEDPQALADLAAKGAAHAPPVLTYVVGLPGVDQTVANMIAAAGGTESAILVAAADVEAEFRKALGKVKGDVLPCNYAVPPQVASGEIELGYVNVEITPGGGKPTVIPHDQSCSGDGWKYDVPGAPTAILLCPKTCDDLKASPGAAITVVLGCATAIK